jgi:Ca2+-binding EF-hand superfamily protein
VDASGKITKENIATAMYKLEHPITKEELDDIMQKHDKKKDGVLSYEEFKNIFLEN